MRTDSEFTRSRSDMEPVSREVCFYLLHTELAAPVREIARAAGCHASTVLRQIQKWEGRREDPIVDKAFHRVAQAPRRQGIRDKFTEAYDMTAKVLKQRDADGTGPADAEMLRVMRRLCETGAVLAVAEGMEKAVVVRDGPDGNSSRTAVATQDVVEELAIRGWIGCDAPGRISRYRITAAGRSALGALMARSESQACGMEEAAADFDRSGAERAIPGAGGRGARRGRYSLADSPLLALARRRDRDGQAFLSDRLVVAGERLREDFELAHIGAADLPRIDWAAVIQGAVLPEEAEGLPQIGVAAARARAAAALRALGPGLADVVLSVCCELEGLEAAEKRMGWSARSGKIVLRIALAQLQRFYATQGHQSVLIG